MPNMADPDRTGQVEDTEDDSRRKNEKPRRALRFLGVFRLTLQVNTNLWAVRGNRGRPESLAWAMSIRTSGRISSRGRGALPRIGNCQLGEITVFRELAITISRKSLRPDDVNARIPEIFWMVPLRVRFTPRHGRC